MYRLSRDRHEIFECHEHLAIRYIHCMPKVKIDSLALVFKCMEEMHPDEPGIVRPGAAACGHLTRRAQAAARELDNVR